MKALRLLCAVGLAAVALSGSLMMAQASASAQSFVWSNTGKSPSPIPPDTYKVNYFSNANTAGAPDGTVRLTNPGTSGKNICAQIYVFDPYQELSECCACLITPNGLRTLSVDTDLTADPLTGVKLTTGTAVVVSGYTSNNVCSPLNNIVSQGGVRAWGTHIQNGAFAVTETESSDVQLTSGNNNLLTDCYALQLVGSGAGTCTCGTGD